MVLRWWLVPILVPYADDDSVLVYSGKTTVQSSVRNILDNYCFVGTVDVTNYDLSGKGWGLLTATSEIPLAATPGLLSREGAAGWIIIGAGAAAVLQVFAGRSKRRDTEEPEQVMPELAWA